MLHMHPRVARPAGSGGGRRPRSVPPPAAPGREIERACAQLQRRSQHPGCMAAGAGARTCAPQPPSPARSSCLSGASAHGAFTRCFAAAGPSGGVEVDRGGQEAPGLESTPPPAPWAPQASSAPRRAAPRRAAVMHPPSHCHKAAAVPPGSYSSPGLAERLHLPPRSRRRGPSDDQTKSYNVKRSSSFSTVVMFTVMFRLRLVALPRSLSELSPPCIAPPAMRSAHAPRTAAACTALLHAYLCCRAFTDARRRQTHTHTHKHTWNVSAYHRAPRQRGARLPDHNLHFIMTRCGRISLL